jgi:hypothetical protein
VRGELKASGALAIRVFLTMRPDDEGVGQFGVLARVGGANVQTVDQQASQDYPAHDVCISYIAQGGLPGPYGFIPLGFEATYTLSYSVWSTEVATGSPQGIAPAPVVPNPAPPSSPTPGPATPVPPVVPPTQTPPASADAMLISPGHGVGPIRIGMSISEAVSLLGVPKVTHGSADGSTNYILLARVR